MSTWPSDWPAGLTLRPLERWPDGLELRSQGRRRTSPFSSTLSATLGLLGRELVHLAPSGKRSAPSVLQMALAEQYFRLDGRPRANAVPEHPGVILNVESRHGPLSYPCDSFRHWQDNLRAIALGLESLRRLDRYGITPGGEQYRGWAALPPGAGGTVSPSSTGSASMDRASAAALLARLSGSGLTVADVERSPECAREALRAARQATHPDRTGSRTDWDLVEQAALVLRLDH